MPNTLTGLLREMACSCYCAPETEPSLKCAHCQALALAEEQADTIAEMRDDLDDYKKAFGEIFTLTRELGRDSTTSPLRWISTAFAAEKQAHEEQERQLAAAQAALKFYRDQHEIGCPSYVGDECRCLATHADEALLNPIATLDAYGERLRAEIMATVICYRAADGSRVWPEPDKGQEHDERVRRETARETLLEVLSYEERCGPRDHDEMVVSSEAIRAMGAAIDDIDWSAKGGGNG